MKSSHRFPLRRQIVWGMRFFTILTSLAVGAALFTLSNQYVRANSLHALFATSLVFFLQAVPDDLYYFAATQFAIGLFFSGIYPSINAILAENTTSHMKGRVFGLLFSAQQIGSMAGPLLGGVIATFVGIKFVFVLAGVIVLIMSVFARRQQKIAMRQYHP